MNVFAKVLLSPKYSKKCIKIYTFEIRKEIMAYTFTLNSKILLLLSNLLFGLTFFFYLFGTSLNSLDSTCFSSTILLYITLDMFHMKCRKSFKLNRKKSPLLFAIDTIFLFFTAYMMYLLFCLKRKRKERMQRLKRNYKQIRIAGWIFFMYLCLNVCFLKIIGKITLKCWKISCKKTKILNK